MVRVAWPLFAAGLVILGVHHMPWPVRSQSQDTYRANSSPSVTLSSASAAPVLICATEDPAPPAPKVQTNSQAPEPEPLPAPPSEYDPSAFNTPQSASRAQPKPPSAGLPTFEEAVEKVEKKLAESFKATSQYTAQPPTAAPPLPTPLAADAPPIITDVPKPPLPSPTPPAANVPPVVTDAPPPGPNAPAPAAPPPAAKAIAQPVPPVQPEPLATPAPGWIGPMSPRAPTGKPITSPWTFHLEIVDGKNVITAKVGKTVQFRVNCDTVDIQSPNGTIQAQGNVKVSSLGLEVSGERMTIQLQEDSMVLEGKAQMKCQREGQEIDLRSERFTLRLSEIHVQTSGPLPRETTTQSSTSQSPRPPIVDVSRDFP